LEVRGSASRPVENLNEEASREPRTKNSEPRTDARIGYPESC
jgi:hypothetical protein